MVQFSFNATQYNPSSGGTSVVPTGDYDVQITGSSVKPTKRQDGNMLVFDLRIVSGEHAGKNLTLRLNIQNPNQQAVEIAYGELSAISHVVGKLNWQDTQELHGIPFRVHVEEVPRQDDPSKSGNEIKSYMDSAGNPPSAGGGGSAPAQPGAPAAPSAPGMGNAPAPAPAAVGGSAPQPASANAPAPAPAQQQQPQQQQSPLPTTNNPADMQTPPAGQQPPAPSQQTGQAPWQQGQPAPQPAQSAPAGGTPPWQNNG